MTFLTEKKITLCPNSRVLFKRTQIAVKTKTFTIGPLQDPVTWYGINYTGTLNDAINYAQKGCAVQL